MPPKKTPPNLKQPTLVILFLGFLFLSPNLFAQKEKENYSSNFKLFGTIIDKETGKPMANDCFHVLGLYCSRTIKTNAKGEYEVLFYDNSGEPFTDSTKMPADEIYIIWCSDPNKMKTISLKKTKVKKEGKDSSKKPVNVKADIKLEFEF